MTDYSPLVELNNIRQNFANMLPCADISACAREIITLIGPNGAGKFILVRVVLGLLTPQQGEIQRQPVAHRLHATKSVDR
ncbi:MAG: ATP-binding cassette domain-containing protein [Thiotrichaceae bacterium]